MPEVTTRHEPGSSARPDLPLAVVVGAGGLGVAVARRLGQSYRLLLADRSAAHLDAQVALLQAEGHDATGQQCDVTCAADVAALAGRARQLGPVRALAHVVGLSPSLGDFRSILSVNLVGAARIVNAFGEVLAPGAAAVCVSSSAAHMTTAAPEALALLDDPLAPDLLPALERLLGDGASSAMAYMLSKKGLIRLCQRQARSWGQRGLRIVSLSPGLIATPQGAGEYRNSPGKLKLFEAIPLGRECTMIEIAGIAEFLLSDAASYITGIDLLVDGGLTAGLSTRPFA